VWAWNITEPHGLQKWTYFYLYAIIDSYSRYVVAWMVADRGSSMTSKPVAFMLADLGVTKSHSRPHVSIDNPHVEAIFKTTKYQPEFSHFVSKPGCRAGILFIALRLVQQRLKHVDNSRR